MKTRYFLLIMASALLYFAKNACGKDVDFRRASLCSASEKIIFSCIIKNSEKYISVCASQGLSRDSGYIQYRFGENDAIELEYPSEKETSRSSFKFSRYTRSKVSKYNLMFSKNNVIYSIFDNYDTESEPFVKEKGVAISGQGIDDKSLKLLCGQGAISNLEDMEEVVACDENLSLGGCK